MNLWCAPLRIPPQASDLVNPGYNEFTGFVFKLQANLDPRHRDRLAYIRVVSGRYEKGMKVGKSPHELYNTSITSATMRYSTPHHRVRKAHAEMAYVDPLTPQRYVLSRCVEVLERASISSEIRQPLDMFLFP